jgi:UDP-N-acetylglucosamine 1-carboxyvinyltransferase
MIVIPGGNKLEKLIIKGGQPLSGEVTISGAKNAVVAILCAALMVEGEVVIENVPDISDVRVAIKILRDFGVCVERQGNSLLINSDTCSPLAFIR